MPTVYDTLRGCSVTAFLFSQLALSFPFAEKSADGLPGFSSSSEKKRENFARLPNRFRVGADLPSKKLQSFTLPKFLGRVSS
jgi:hypothetical protein